MFEKHQTSQKFYLQSLPSTLDQSNFLVTIDGSVSDRNSSAELIVKLLARLSVIEKCHFTSTQKCWVLQHLLILWPLLIYKIPISLAFKMEQKVSVFYPKRLHVHHSTSSLCFHSIQYLGVHCQSKAYHQH